MELILYSGDGIYASSMAARETDELSRQFSAESGLIDAVMAEGGLAMTREVQLAGRPWVASLRPFGTNSDVQVLAVSLISQDSVLAGYRELQRTMILVGLAMIGAGLLGALLLARRVTEPLKKFSEAAIAASEGDYDQQFERSSGNEISRLGRAFDTLLSDLRERRDMEDFVTDLSRYLPEPGSEAAATRTESGVTQAPVHRTVALLGLDYRSVAADSGDASSHIKELERRLATAEACAEGCGGRIEAVMGHRVILGFDGEDSALEALVCSGELARADQQLPPMALVCGEADRGSVRTGRLRTGVVLGKPSQQMDLLLEEARPGQLLLSPSVKAVLAEALDEPQPAVIAGRITGNRYYSLGPGQLASLPGVEGGIDTSTTDESASSMATGGARAGDVFADRYEIEAVLGSGGMGMVYKALDREVEDFVALKTLLPEIASDAHYLESLKEELRLARRITHANVLRTFDFGSYNNTAYISMEYVRGMTLRYLLAQRPQLPYSAGLRISRQLCAGLAAAHEQDVIHRDIKPENLILEAAGNAKLMDFGIARPVAKLATDQAQNVFVGTPRYASPEQMEGKPVDPTADVFASGVLMYEMFTGVAPFAGKDLMEIYTAKLEQKVATPSTVWPDIPPALEQIIMRCLASESDRRYANAAALGRALSKLRA
jgi:serine/threonine-protein kinase